MFDLKGKRALVCGASRGIGAATAHLFAKLGAEVILLARTESRLKTVLDSLDSSSNQSHGMLLIDLMEIDSKIDAITHLTEQQPIHILVNNTGGPAPGPILQAEPSAFEAAFKAHLISHQTLTQALVPQMKEMGYGRIINILSTSVKQPIVGLGVSNTIRAAVANWAKTLAGELGPHGITVNNVLPGFTRTERLDTIIANKMKKQKSTQDEVIANMISQVPCGRFAEAQELAQAVAFLASPTAAYINGINLPVDGGRLNTL